MSERGLLNMWTMTRAQGGYLTLWVVYLIVGTSVTAVRVTDDTSIDSWPRLVDNADITTGASDVNAVDVSKDTYHHPWEDLIREPVIDSSINPYKYKDNELKEPTVAQAMVDKILADDSAEKQLEARGKAIGAEPDISDTAEALLKQVDQEETSSVPVNKTVTGATGHANPPWTASSNDTAGQAPGHNASRISGGPEEIKWRLFQLHQKLQHLSTQRAYLNQELTLSEEDELQRERERAHEHAMGEKHGERAVRDKVSKTQTKGQAEEIREDLVQAGQHVETVAGTWHKERDAVRRDHALLLHLSQAKLRQMAHEEAVQRQLQEVREKKEQALEDQTEARERRKADKADRKEAKKEYYESASQMSKAVSKYNRHMLVKHLMESRGMTAKHQAHRFRRQEKHDKDAEHSNLLAHKRAITDAYHAVKAEKKTRFMAESYALQHEMTHEKFRNAKLNYITLFGKQGTETYEAYRLNNIARELRAKMLHERDVEWQAKQAAKSAFDRSAKEEVVSKAARKEAIASQKMWAQFKKVSTKMGGIAEAGFSESLDAKVTAIGQRMSFMAVFKLFMKNLMIAIAERIAAQVTLQLASSAPPPAMPPLQLAYQIQNEIATTAMEWAMKYGKAAIKESVKAVISAMAQMAAKAKAMIKLGSAQAAEATVDVMKAIMAKLGTRADITKMHAEEALINAELKDSEKEESKALGNEAQEAYLDMDRRADNHDWVAHHARIAAGDAWRTMMRHFRKLDQLMYKKAYFEHQHDKAIQQKQWTKSRVRLSDRDVRLAQDRAAKDSQEKEEEEVKEIDYRGNAHEEDGKTQEYDLAIHDHRAHVLDSIADFQEALANEHQEQNREKHCSRKRAHLANHEAALAVQARFCAQRLHQISSLYQQTQAQLHKDEKAEQDYDQATDDAKTRVRTLQLEWKRLKSQMDKDRSRLRLERTLAATHLKRAVSRSSDAEKHADDRSHLQTELSRIASEYEETSREYRRLRAQLSTMREKEIQKMQAEDKEIFGVSDQDSTRDSMGNDPSAYALLKSTIHPHEDDDFDIKMDEIDHDIETTGAED